MKSVYRLILLSCLMFALTCVSAQDSVSTQEPTLEVTSQQPEEVSILDLGDEIVATHPWKIVWVRSEPVADAAKSAWGHVVGKGIREGADDFHVTIEIMYPECERAQEANSNCVEAQIRLMAGLIERTDIDGVILSVLDHNRLVPVVEKLYKAGIPVVIDQQINTDKVTTKVGFSELKMGQMLGEWVVQNTDDNANIVMLEGRPDAASSRRIGILNGLDTGNITVLDTAVANWRTDEAYNITQDWIERFPDIDVVIAQSDGMMVGAWQALTEATRTDVVLVWYGPHQDMVTLLQEGHPSAFIDQRPAVFGRAMVQAMVRYLETGETLPPHIYVPARLVTIENVDEYLADQ